MELRQFVAYALIALLAAFAAGMLLWRGYHSRDRTVTRNRRREREAGERRIAEREQNEA